MLQTAFQMLQSGQPARAEALARTALATAPDGETPLLFLALAMEAQGRRLEALPVFEQLTRLYPATSAHWNNLGNLLRALERTEEATSAFTHALSLEPQDPHTLFNLALLALDLGETHAARGHLLEALRYAPADALIRVEAASACYRCGDGEQAEQLLNDWQQWAASDPLAFAEVGWLFTRIGRGEDARVALDRAARELPGHPRVQLRHAAFLERSNRLEEAAAALARIDTASAIQEGLGEELAIVRADISARSDAAEALLQYQRLVDDPRVARRHPAVLSAMARLNDQTGNVDAAMAMADRAHAVQLEELRRHAPEWLQPDADPLGITRHRIDAAQRSQWVAMEAPDDRESPIFVLGFPRSGTTMLETMLDAHPQLAGMDERSFLQDVIDEVRKSGLRYPEDIGQFDAPLCERLRALYWHLVRSRAGIGEEHRLVDKNPLNILRLPLIARLWPSARIILALRHPCDVVLSNYLQTFRTPAYVALCASLESTARGYADTFDFWIDHAEVLQPRVLELRYEDVVDDIQAQSRRIADFLAIDWHPDMVDFPQRARERGYIGTPSYHQVVQPLNRRGIARWERYAAHLQPVLPLLQRYMDRWDYPG